MKTMARMVVNLVQKVLPLVPRRLWPVPENKPAPAFLGCWMRTTAIKRTAVNTNKTRIRVCMAPL